MKTLADSAVLAERAAHAPSDDYPDWLRLDVIIDHLPFTPRNSFVLEGLSADPVRSGDQRFEVATHLTRRARRRALLN
ncbi:MAG: hypothetical protein HZA80_01645 [Candidatus Taylorbacteria bacterium]|nr:hypothetical protein [Candidatus Taylorbacteria bacterium]